MKTTTKLLLFVFLISTVFFSYSQNSETVSQEKTLSYLERSPIYDYTELNLNNRDTIPGFASMENKLKISGTIYKSDGVTPAKNVILYIEHTNELGNFELKKEKGKRYVHHRSWVKTNADGRYTIFTFIPGNNRRFNMLQQLFPIIKETSQGEYALESFLFNTDPLLSRLCRKRLSKKGDLTRVLEPKEENGMFVVEKNIVLTRGNPDS